MSVGELRVPLTEAEFQKQVTDLADLRGWQWMHIQRMGDPMGHWRTPVTGPLGKGWPDLVLVRGNHLIFAELKREHMGLTTFQRDVYLTLNGAAPYFVRRLLQSAALKSVCLLRPSSDCNEHMQLPSYQVSLFLHYVEESDDQQCQLSVCSPLDSVDIDDGL